MADLTTIRGTVAKVFHRSVRWSAGILASIAPAIDEPAEVRFRGNAYVREGELVGLRGAWVDDPEWGRQFDVKEKLIDDKPTKEGLANWLAVNGKIENIGPERAKRIAEKFGDNLGDSLRMEPERIARECKVPVAAIQNLALKWMEGEQENVVGALLAGYGLTHTEIQELYAKFKGSIIAMLEDNPYMLLGEVPGLGFVKVDKIAAKAGVARNHTGRVDAGIRFTLSSEQRKSGSTCIEESDLIDEATKLLGLADEPVLMNDRLTAMIEARHVREVRDGEVTLISLPNAYRHESAVAAFFSTANRGNPQLDPSLAANYLRDECTHLDDSQRAAVLLAVTKRACLISGGAGSGKTTTIKAIAEVYRRQGRTVALCAPTGKAARRLEEVMAGTLEASTIHRLLEYRGGKRAKAGACQVKDSKVFGYDASRREDAPVTVAGFLRGPHHPLQHDVVIVDEVSMLGSELAFHLLGAIQTGTAVVFVGDHHQLQPVDYGAILRDAIKNDLLPVAILGQCHRQAGDLKRNAAKILDGAVPDTTPHDIVKAGPGPWYVAKYLDAESSVLAYIQRLFTEIIPEKLGYDRIKDVQFLSPQHSGAIGTDALNLMLQGIYQRWRGQEVAPVESGKAPNLYVGDKVIQTENDYDLELMNGHQGVVVDTNPLTVAFDIGEIVIPRDCTGNISLAYALTTHKVQGSEFPCVVVVCHSKQQFMLHRNWLYTGCTRAKKTCILVGNEVGVKKAALKVESDRRRTILPLLCKGMGHASDQPGS